MAGMWKRYADVKSFTLTWTGGSPLAVYRSNEATDPFLVVKSGEVMIFANTSETFHLKTDDRTWDVVFHPGGSLNEGDGLILTNASVIDS